MRRLVIPRGTRPHKKGGLSARPLGNCTSKEASPISSYANATVQPEGGGPLSHITPSDVLFLCHHGTLCVFLLLNS
uniref:Uncharacterized protein n=1 Tax=Gossypium raimondii TaxID=29730 RepID=A0A0D2TPR3_GOSRA|nr:hypothetical protein B456_009G231500 [Gossypium raimondii]